MSLSYKWLHLQALKIKYVETTEATSVFKKNYFKLSPIDFTLIIHISWYKKLQEL